MTRLPTPRLLVAAPITGIAGDLLLRGNGMWRLGLLLWVAIVVISVLVVAPERSRERNVMLAGALAAAVGLVVRDAPLLWAIDILSLACMAMLTFWHGSGRSLGELSIIESARAVVLAAANTLGGAVGVLSRRSATRGSDSASTGRTKALLTGVVLAVPPLVIVTGLLVASDRVFESAVERVANLASVEHVFVTLLVTWFATGWIRAAAGDAIGGDVPAPPSLDLRWATVAVPLYALVVVLTLFLVTQARVLFGGAAFLQESQGLTVATYARDGFFQLIVASGVVLGTLVLAEWLLIDEASARQHYRVAGRVLLGLVTTLLVSGAVRIGIYVQMFGHSVDRTFAIAAIVWVLLALITCAATTLQHHPQRFASTTVAVTIVWVVIMNVLNPEAMVVRLNVARAVTGATFDATYHASLSADAGPALLANAARLPRVDCEAAANAMRQVWATRSDAPAAALRDWRGLDLPLARMERWHANGGTLTC